MSNKRVKWRSRALDATANDAFERALLGEEQSRSKTFDPREDRKTLQLCRQVKRSLMLALAGECDDEVLRDVYVEFVQPVGNGSHLLVGVTIPAGLETPAWDVVTRLNERSGRLRAIIARSICRKRVPGLSFVAVPQGQGLSGERIMNDIQKDGAPVKTWLTTAMDTPVKQVIERIRRADDVARISVMPDVHLAGDVCVGTAMATRSLIYPSAVGGDIGCGMQAVAFNASCQVLRDARNAGEMLRLLGQRIPTQRRNRRHALALPARLKPGELSHPSLQALAEDEGKLQFGTLGGGNHFVEMQADEEDRLWLMIHSGSRAVGQAVKGYHLTRAAIHSAGMRALDSTTEDGQAYLHDQEWARRFAEANRQAMMEQVVEILRDVFEIEVLEPTIIVCDHNHVRRETHFGESLLVHRKGAMPAENELGGVVPGSMGTFSYHVEGRGCAESLMSSAHGAGRNFSRHAARERFSRKDLCRQMAGVWFDPRLGENLREESPKSYKDVQLVMRAQRE